MCSGNTDRTVRAESEAADAAGTKLQISEKYFSEVSICQKKKKKAVDDVDKPIEKNHFSTCLCKHQKLLK